MIHTWYMFHTANWTFSAPSKALSSGLSGRFSPKLMIESWSWPLHFGSSHILEVRWSETFLLSRVLKSLMYSRLHFLQCSKFVFPWSSASSLGLRLLLRCRPSTFWLTVRCTRPASCSFKMAMWVTEGRAYRGENTQSQLKTTPLRLISFANWYFTKLVRCILKMNIISRICTSQSTAFQTHVRIHILIIMYLRIIIMTIIWETF